MISGLVPFPNGVQAVITYTMPGIAPVHNRLWFLNRQPPTTGDQVQALADGLLSHWEGAVMPLLAPDLVLGSVLTYQWDIPFGGALGLAVSGMSGGASSAAHSANVAIRVAWTWPIDVNLRSGSNFVPGVPLDAVDVNMIEPTFAAAIRSAYVDIIDLAGGWGPFPAWEWVNVSLQVGHEPRGEAVAGAAEFVSVPSPYVSPRRMRVTP